MAREESKHDRFKRIATKRVNVIIRKIEGVGKLASPGYQYTDEEIERIVSTLQDALDNAKARFSAKRPEVKKFEL